MAEHLFFMKGNLKIHTGELKGKSIPVVEIKSKSNFTPAILKKAVFSIIHSALEELQISLADAVFADYFAGSGQMGFEALSLGFGTVHINEIENERFGTIRNFAKSIQTPDRLLLHRKDGFRFFPETGNKITICFLDPPYSTKEEDSKKLKKLVLDLAAHYNNYYIFVQTPVAMNEFEFRKSANQYLHTIKSW